MSDASIPHGWTTASLRDLIDKKFTGPSPTCEERPVASDEEWGLLKTTAVTWDGWNEAAHKVPPAEYWGNESIEVHADDVLITKAGPRHRVGVVVHVGATQPRIMVSGKMVGLRPKKTIVLPVILAGLLSTNDTQGYLNSRTTGMAESQTNFADEALLASPLKVPPMSEQRRIAEILEALHSQIRVTEQIVAKLLVVKRGIVRDLLTYGIDEMGSLRHPRLHADEFEPTSLGLLPKGWKTSSLDEVCSVIVDCPHSTPTFLNSGVLVARTTNIKSGVFVEESASFVSGIEYAKRIWRAEPSPGDIILTREAPVGEAFVIPARMRICLGQRVMLLRPRIGVLEPHYLLTQLYSGLVKERIDLLAAGTTNPHLNVAEVKRFVLPIPTYAEQMRISARVITCDARIQAELARLKKQQAYKRGLMADLFTGRVRVPIEPVS